MFSQFVIVSKIVSKKNLHLFFSVLTFLAVMATGSKSEAANVLIIDGHIVGGWTGVSFERNSGSGTDFNSSRSLSYGLGVGLEFPLTKSLGFVTGADYLHRRFEMGVTIGNTKVGVERTVPTLLVPLMLRAWLGDAFYLQGGAYASKGIGSVKDDYVAGDSSLFNFESSKRKGIDFGAIAGLGVNVAAFGKTGLYVQAQYLHGFTDSASSSVFSENLRDVLISTGLRAEL